MNEWVQIISTVGFPIVAFLICVYGLKYAYDKSREDNKSALEQISKLADAINNNTIALANLVEEIHREQKEDYFNHG